MKIIWKDLKGYESLYKICNNGCIINKMLKKVMKPQFKNGHFQVMLSDINHKRNGFYISTLLYKNFSIDELKETKIQMNDRKRGIIYNNKWYSSIKELADDYNINGEMVAQRIHKFGWTVEESLSIPLKRKTCKLKVKLYEYKGNLYSISQICNFKEAKINKATLRGRLKRGWTVESALFIPVAKKRRKNGIQI